MGNQLSGIAPSQILPVEYYLTDVGDYEFEASLGSTRFFKVARARHAEGPAVVKVFVVHDPSLPLHTYAEQLELLHKRLAGASNCLPFARPLLSEKAALLFRQFVKDSLYDRISTRPFLNQLEKRWLAFQLLCALNQMHKLQVCHGDLKAENVMVTSWNWLLIADFAIFKPTYLPEDNPADFSYFFDTSRRRTCYLAPERFVERGRGGVEAQSPDAGLLDEAQLERAADALDLTDAGYIKRGDVTPSMDIFSAGCVIAELFSEGKPPFDLSELLGFRSGEYSPNKFVSQIDDTDIQELVMHMLNKDPSQRLSAEEYLVAQKDRAFPGYFYTFLKLYLQKFATSPVISADDRITRISRDLGVIMKQLGVTEADTAQNTSLVLIVSVVTAALRSLQYCKSKLLALQVLQRLAVYVPPDVILDRILPFMLHMVHDKFPRVRAEAIRAITACLADVKSVPASDANIFPEYILPGLDHLTSDTVVAVRVAYAESIAKLAETALRFLEMMQLQPKSEEEAEAEAVGAYDTELQVLHEAVQQKVSTLLSDFDNIVKMTLLESGITRLCVFFGRQKASDVLLSHMLTFLNDKQDWHLRASFFDNIVGVAAYVGWQSSTILKPFLQQGLSDPEEFVVHKTLVTLTSLTELCLLQKQVLHELASEVVPLFVHPGVWVRQGAVGFIAAAARALNIADVHCNLLPLVTRFLRHDIIQLDKEVVLLDALRSPLPRLIFDYLVRSPQCNSVFVYLSDRKTARHLSRPGHPPHYTDPGEGIVTTWRKLTSQGLTELEEDKLLALKDLILKLQQGKNSVATDSEVGSSSGLLQVKRHVTRRHADLRGADSGLLDGHLTLTKKTSRKKPPPLEPSSMNEDWKAMFGSTSVDPTLLSRTLPSGVVGSPVNDTSDTRHGKTHPQQNGRDNIQARYATCRLELSTLVSKKREQFSSERMGQDVLDSATWDNRPPPANWRPKGHLVAHLHEHRGAVNRLAVSSDHSLFASCSNDGTVKVWDCGRMDGKSVTNRSRLSYNRQGGQIKCLAFCQQNYSIAAASDSGAIHVFKVDGSSSKVQVLHTRNLDVEEDGLVVDMNHMETGCQSVLTYATVHGYLIGWDLRSPKQAWHLRNEPKHGLITTFDIHENQAWLALGTSSGAHVCWDLRFHLPISTLPHPTGARTRRLLAHPAHTSCIISAAQGNNEISMWDLETGARQKTMWASPAPALSRTQASAHSVNGLHLGVTDSNTFLLSAGSDMRLRYWDMSYPANSYIIATAANDPTNQVIVSYRSRLIEGTEVIQEVYGKSKVAPPEPAPPRGPEVPAAGHHDVISDVTVCQTSQCLIITCARDGVIKVWK